MRQEIKKKGENGNREGRKGISLSSWDIFFQNNQYTTCFHLRFTKILGKANLDFPNKICTCKLKDIKLFEDLWTTN